MLPSPRSPISFVPALALVAGLAALPACGGGGGGDDSPSDTGATKDAGVVDSGRHDAKASSGGDTGITVAPPPVEDDASVAPSTNPALDPIAGRYLMRWDSFGTATSTIGTLSVQIRSRVSNLFVTELVVDGDHLRATERLCNQTALQKCLSGCQTATTTVDQRVVDNFLHKTQFSRDYTLSADNKTITGGSSTSSFGYDGNGDLPTSSTDPLVWDPIPDAAPREAMLTSLAVRGVPLLGDITCDVYGVEKFISTFSGDLGGSSSKPTFPNMELTFQDGTGANRLGSTSVACDAAGDSPLDKATVQLVRYGDNDGDAFWNCYDDDTFDQQVPPTKDSMLDGN